MKPSLEQAVDCVLEEIEDNYTSVETLHPRGAAGYVVRHNESGKHYKFCFTYDSWRGMETDYFLEDPVEVEQVEVLAKMWKAV
jgi:hypothetical protein